MKIENNQDLTTRRSTSSEHKNEHRRHRANRFTLEQKLELRQNELLLEISNL